MQPGAIGFNFDSSASVVAVIEDAHPKLLGIERWKQHARTSSDSGSGVRENVNGSIITELDSLPKGRDSTLRREARVSSYRDILGPWKERY